MDTVEDAKIQLRKLVDQGRIKAEDFPPLLKEFRTLGLPETKGAPVILLGETKDRFVS